MEHEPDLITEFMLDGNSVAGLMYEMFGVEMTAEPTECAHCGMGHNMGALLVFSQAPGIIMRCPTCENVMVRIVQTPYATYIDARGAAFIRISRAAVA